MKVLITGAAGLVGSVTTQEFLAHGYEVRALDVKPLASRRDNANTEQKLEMVYADILDKLSLLRACEGCAAVVHLAALGSMHKDEDRCFHANVVGTQLVLAAAEASGIKRVVLASSNCALGIVYSEGRRLPQYLPVDEAHPALADDYYGLSKIINEQTAAAFAQRSAMTVICLRLTNVLNFNRGPQYRLWQRWQLREQTDLRYHDLWAYLFQEDAARAFRFAVEQPLEGHHVINIAATDSYTVHDIRDLVRRNLPALAEMCDRLEPHQCLYDLTAARTKLNFTAAKSWRDEPDLASILDDENQELESAFRTISKHYKEEVKEEGA